MLRRIRKDELKALGLRNGLVRLADHELDEYAKITESFFDILDPLDRVSDQPSRIDAIREVGRIATRSEDPLNAVVRWCSVGGDREGALEGKRIGLKDSMAVAGVPMTCGSRILQNHVPASDSVLAERVIRAGGKIVAILNMDEFAFSAGGDTSYYGPILNPHDLSRTAGGSSGGSGAALAYADFDITYGTDQGGSIRVPAAWCGVLGLKPSYGLVPYTGIAASDQTYDHAGPLARTVSDLALGLEVIAGADESDPRQRGLNPPTIFCEAVRTAPEALNHLTIGVVREGFRADFGIQRSVSQATMEAVNRLRSLGARIVEIDIPAHKTEEAACFATFIEGATAAMDGFGNGYHWSGRYAPELSVALGRGLKAWGEELPPHVKAVLLLGTHLREHYFSSLYAKAQNLRPALRKAYDDALKDVDVLLMPTTNHVAHPFVPDMSLSERVLTGWSMLSNTTPFNMTGHPSLSIPAAQADGLPVGVMLTGRMFDDARLLSIARTYERAFGWQPELPTIERQRT